MTNNISDDERILRRIPLEIVGLSCLMALIAFPLFDALTALLIIAGGALATLSFLWLRQTVSKMLIVKKGDIKKGDSRSKLKNGDSPKEETGQPPFIQSSFFKKALRLALPFYVLRIVLILGIFFIIIFFFSNKIIAFAVGFSTLVPVFLIEAVIALSKMKEWKN
jgi:hypothetical protein